MTIKPFSTYPEDREELLKLCAKVETGYDSEFTHAAYKLADMVKSILSDEKFTEANEARDAAALDVLLTPRHIDEWSEDDGSALWWTFPITEGPYLGSPLICGHTVEMRHYIGGEGEIKTVSTSVGGWPGYHEWWTPLPTNDQVKLIQKRIEVAKRKAAAE